MHDICLGRHTSKPGAYVVGVAMCWYSNVARSCGCILLVFIYVTVFAKRDHLGANLDFEFCIQHESTLDELPVALYCASLASSVSEIRSFKVRNYEHSVFMKTAFKRLLPVNPVFCHVTNDVIA